MNLIVGEHTRPPIWLNLSLAVEHSVVQPAFAANLYSLLDYTILLFTLVGDAEPRGMVL